MLSRPVHRPCRNRPLDGPAKRLGLPSAGILGSYTIAMMKKASPQPAHAVVIQPRKDNVRETVESIVIAFVLAFLFRTFEAEAFVIPTGSMAPTLMGQHKDINCPQCGFGFQVGVKEDPSQQIYGCTCPNCRYDITFSRDFKTIPPSFKGDRIIVSKFPYEFGDPSRWDVSVFKYPATAKTNFIKRIVGLPNETLRIYRGDIYTRPDGTTDFRIERKPPAKVLAMLQTVYDNDYCQPSVLALGMPPRWAPPGPDESGAWKRSADGASFETAGVPASESWIRYEHRLPSQQDWAALQRAPNENSTREMLARIEPTYITDFCAYDTGKGAGIGTIGTHWVGDLGLECELDVRGSGGEATLELIKRGRRFQCRFALSTGTVALSADDLPAFRPKATTKVHGAGVYRLRMTNVDQELLVWVDGRLLEFDAPTSYDLPWQRPADRDLSPVGIAVRGVQAAVSHLQVMRDVYYTPDEKRGKIDTRYTTYGLEGSADAMDFELGPGEFLALGDNSPQSKDGRMWDRFDPEGNPEYYVSRELLIGKAMFVYWPHALEYIPGTHIHVPMIPNFARMRFIR